MSDFLYFGINIVVAFVIILSLHFYSTLELLGIGDALETLFGSTTTYGNDMAPTSDSDTKIWICVSDINLELNFYNIWSTLQHI